MKKTIYCILMALSLIGLVLQLYVSLQSTKFSKPMLVFNFFSYFTILTNVIVCLSYIGLFTQHKGFKLFYTPNNMAAITVYIIVVGAIYNLLLAKLWNPKGLQLIADTLLHTIIPIAYTLHWIFVVKKNALHWSLIGQWVLYPIAYLVYTLIRGAILNWYPYFFIDVSKLGYVAALQNALWVALFFIFLFAVCIGASKWLFKKQTN